MFKNQGNENNSTIHHQSYDRIEQPNLYLEMVYSKKIKKIVYYFSVGSSGSSLSEGWARPTQAAAAAPTTTRTPLSLLLEKVCKQLFMRFTD